MSTPERMCVVCRQMKDKRSLIRVVKDKDGNVKYDPTGKMPGRGAYLCASRACFERLCKTKGFERSLKCMVPEEILTAVNDKIGE